MIFLHIGVFLKSKNVEAFTFWIKTGVLVFNKMNTNRYLSSSRCPLKVMLIEFHLLTFFEEYSSIEKKNPTSETYYTVE